MPLNDETPNSVDNLNSKEDVIEFLGEKDTPKETIDIKEPPKPKVKEEEEDELEEELTEDDELKELEEELEGPDEEKLELITPVRRKEILKAFPDLFKKFPYLERAYYRDQKFTELLPTIEDAKEAVVKAQTLDNFERDILGGNTETLLKSVRENDQQAFLKIVDNYLPALAKVDERAYQHVIGNVIKHTITAMVQEGRRSSNDVLQNAAQILNQYVFGTSDFVPPQNLVKPSQVDPEKEKLVEREKQFARQQFETVLGDLSSRVQNTIKGTIENNIDPRGSMTDYVKKNAIKDAADTLEQYIQKDARFRAVLDKMWENAAKSNFSKESVERIRSTYLSKAKTLLPTVIKKARNEALRSGSKRSTENKDESPIKVGKSTSSSNSGKAKNIPKNMKTLDFLMQD